MRSGSSGAAGGRRPSPVLAPRGRCSAFIRALLGIARRRGGDEGHRAALLEDRSDTRFKAQKNPCQDLKTGTSGSRRLAVKHHVRSRSPAEPCGCPGTDLPASLLSAAGHVVPGWADRWTGPRAFCPASPRHETRGQAVSPAPWDPASPPSRDAETTRRVQPDGCGLALPASPSAGLIPGCADPHRPGTRALRG